MRKVGERPFARLHPAAGAPAFVGVCGLGDCGADGDLDSAAISDEAASAGEQDGGGVLDATELLRQTCRGGTSPADCQYPLLWKTDLSY